MPSAARVLGASFLIDSLIRRTPGHQHNTFQDLKSLTRSSQSDEVVEVPQSTPTPELTARTAENSQPGKKLWIQEDNPSKVKAECTNASQFKNELDIPKRQKSDGREWAPGNIHSEEKPELFDTNHLKDNTGTSKSNNSEILSMKVPEKPNHSYIALISRAILSSPEKRLQLSDIYQWIMESYPYYHNQEKSWRNSVRHNLSLNECFIKAGRSDNGKGHYWAVHPANLEAFSRGDYQRRRARRRGFFNSWTSTSLSVLYLVLFSSTTLHLLPTAESPLQSTPNIPSYRTTFPANTLAFPHASALAFSPDASLCLTQK
ncbi:forkhead box D3-like [Pelobates cultripes]|uniref:Forkhead box D3-like n=1 Tax=Pelobates cultripes TaxID=61616 RepID=A0AAD1SY43_PELCU|nr:forkhead box D3-like [Pelobates cultripes]